MPHMIDHLSSSWLERRGASDVPLRRRRARAFNSPNMVVRLFVVAGQLTSTDFDSGQSYVSNRAVTAVGGDRANAGQASGGFGWWHGACSARLRSDCHLLL